jgi:hypothetical protein
MEDGVMPISITEQIACVRREIAMRERVYPKWVAAKRMKEDAADRELAVMRAVLATLEGLPFGITGTQPELDLCAAKPATASAS